MLLCLVFLILLNTKIKERINAKISALFFVFLLGTNALTLILNIDNSLIGLTTKKLILDNALLIFLINIGIIIRLLLNKTNYNEKMYMTSSMMALSLHEGLLQVGISTLLLIYFGLKEMMWSRNNALFLKKSTSIVMGIWAISQKVFNQARSEILDILICSIFAGALILEFYNLFVLKSEKNFFRLTLVYVLFSNGQQQFMPNYVWVALVLLALIFVFIKDTNIFMKILNNSWLLKIRQQGIIRKTIITRCENPPIVHCENNDGAIQFDALWRNADAKIFVGLMVVVLTVLFVGLEVQR